MKLSYNVMDALIKTDIFCLVAALKGVTIKVSKTLLP